MRLTKFLKHICDKNEKSEQRMAHDKWIKDNGEYSLRLCYNLNKNSIVFDVGGYKGQWSSDIFSKYCCNIHIFEPINEYYSFIHGRFLKNKKIFINAFGLSNKTEYTNILKNKDGSSIFKRGDDIEQIHLVNIIEYLNEKQISNIDLMKINIEGGEYPLLEHLIETGFISKIQNIQVQFHDFIPDAEDKRNNIQENLKETHHLTYNYPFIWENWELNFN